MCIYRYNNIYDNNTKRVYTIQLPEIVQDTRFPEQYNNIVTYIFWGKNVKTHRVVSCPPVTQHPHVFSFWWKRITKGIKLNGNTRFIDLQQDDRNVTHTSFIHKHVYNTNNILLLFLLLLYPRSCTHNIIMISILKCVTQNYFQPLVICRRPFHRKIVWQNAEVCRRPVK